MRYSGFFAAAYPAFAGFVALALGGGLLSACNPLAGAGSDTTDPGYHPGSGIGSTPAVLSINLFSFTGGEYIAGGSTQNIIWSATDPNSDTPAVSISYSTNGTIWTPIASGIQGSSSFSWTVPSITSSTVQIKAVVTTSSGNSATSTGGTFVIENTAPTVSLTSFNGGQLVGGGTSQTVSWTASDTYFGASPIAIQYSNNDGSTWNTVATNVANTGTYAWVTPMDTSSQCLIRISATNLAGLSTTATSAAIFSIDQFAPDCFADLVARWAVHRRRIHPIHHLDRKRMLRDSP